MRYVLPRLVALPALALVASTAYAQCPPEAPLRNYTGGGSVTCPCFVSGEEAGVVLQAPASHYPIEIKKIRIGWGSVFGGSPQSLEQAIKIYPAGLPNPGSPQFSLAAPVLSDGFINEFDISSIPGNKTIASGPFTISLEFANSNAGTFNPSVVHDGNGCQPGKNVVKAIPGGWKDACALGVTGDWVMEVVYERAAHATPFNTSNPMTLSSVNSPSLGAAWTSNLDCSAHAPNLAFILAYSAPAVTPKATAWGDLLLDVGSFKIFQQSKPHGGSTASFTNNIPNDTFFCGLTLFMQGACTGSPGIELSNGLEVRVGN